MFSKAWRAAVVIAALAFLLAGCATLQKTRDLLTPETPAETVVAAYGLYAMVGFTTADLLRQGLISVDKAQSVQHYLHKIRPNLAAVRLLVQRGKPLPDSAREWLHKTYQALLLMRQTLRSKYGSKNGKETRLGNQSGAGGDPNGHQRADCRPGSGECA